MRNHVRITIHDGPPPTPLMPLMAESDGDPLAPKPGDERYLLTHAWQLRRFEYDGTVWKADRVVASTTTMASLAAANALLSGMSEMGLAKPWGEARTFLEYDEEGRLVAS